MSRYHPESFARFQRGTESHEMAVLHDEGIYRHLHFRAPGSSFYWFDLVTWPGSLTINGDMGTFTFSRTDDMFEFFTSGVDINPGYWAEKVRAGRDEIKRFDEDVFKKMVTERLEEHIADEGLDDEAASSLREAVKDEVLEDWDAGHESGAHQALQDFDHAGFRFHDTWEWDLKDYTAQYLWCCHAIRWGIAKYRAAKAVAA